MIQQSQRGVLRVREEKNQVYLCCAEVVSWQLWNLSVRIQKPEGKVIWKFFTSINKTEFKNVQFFHTLWFDVWKILRLSQPNLC